MPIRVTTTARDFPETYVFSDATRFAIGDEGHLEVGNDELLAMFHRDHWAHVERVTIDSNPAEVRNVLADVYRKVLAVADVGVDEAIIDRLVTELMPDVEDAFLLAVRKAQTDLKERS